ncbi:sel1 repeat family protein [Myxococcota bacterium]|nr:sel1 repeat family protein [Myxococcota bacterium]MBU1897274.1 sel1 repeat family protein [Myxococcota bacterium]
MTSHTSPQDPPVTSPTPLVPIRALVGFIVAMHLLLFGLGFIPRVAESPPVQRAIWGAAAVTALWTLLLWLKKRPLSADVLIRRAHWVQILMHSTIFIYWGFYYDEVRRIAPLILAQIPLAYLVSLLTAWTLGRRWHLGFGPIPIIGSTNLFLWFKDPWFHWQLVMVALAFMGKDLVRWRRNGGKRHIFNPSGLALSVVSLVVILGGDSSITWGNEIATRLQLAPHMFEVIFAVGVTVQLLFGVAWTTLAAAGSVWLIGLAYTWLTGDWFFTDTTIPIAVFLGMNLLITDPVTSPDNASGKALFGALYGVMVFPLYIVLPLIGQPAFYDKLLQVPLCNLMAPPLERWGARIEAWWASIRPGQARLTPRGARWAAVMGWGALFLIIRPGLIAHPGAEPSAWRDRCAQGEAKACVELKHTLEKGCALGRAEVCHALATQLLAPEALLRNPARGHRLLTEACAAGYAPSCAALTPSKPQPPSVEAHAAHEAGCDAGDGAACLRLAGDHLRAASGRGTLMSMRAFERACELGEAAGCVNLGLMLLRGDGVPADPARAVTLHERACGLGLIPACARLGVLYKKGVGASPDLKRATAAFEQACAGGDQASCVWLEGR